MSITPSKYQQAIYDWIITGKGNCIIQAVAGSGKTTTIVNATKLIPTTSSAVFVAFNKAIAEELKTRLPANIKASTLHSLGLSMFQPNTNAYPKIDSDKMFNIILQVSEEEQLSNKEKDKYLQPLRKILPLIKSTLINYKNFEELDELMTRFEIELEVDDKFISLIDKCLEKAKQMVNIIDFDDMIWIPIVNNFGSKKYDYVFVDEVQDLNKAQFELVKKVCNKNTRVIAVGDKYQCQPEDTEIQMANGTKKFIKDIKIGDKVVSASRWNTWHFVSDYIQGRKVINKSSRLYSGKFYTIFSNNKRSKCTPNHKWIVKVDLNNSNTQYVTYLMKKDNNYRIGQCKLSYGKGVRNFGIWQRCKDEEADAVWILDLYENEQQSKIQEQVLGYKYGIPTIRFVPSKANKWQQNNYNEVYAFIEKFEEKAKKILTDFNREIDYPIWKKGERTIINWLGAKQIFEVEACNLLPSCMKISSYDTYNQKHMNWQPFEIKINNVENIVVYSLKIETHEVYVSDGLLTHNSIYAFRGADTLSMDKFKEHFNAEEFPLSICYRCPRKVINMAKTIVPEIECKEDAEDGIVDEIIGKEMFTIVQDSDLILSRTNAPLIPVAFELLRQGKKAIIRGRDIGANLIKMVDKYKVTSLKDLESRISDFMSLQNEKLVLIEQGKYDKKKKNSLLSVVDSCETVLFLANEVETIDELKEKIKTIFSDDKAGIICSSVHKAKGLEADNVFIIQIEKMPHPMAKTDEEIEQEYNIKYVALTRAKKAMYIVV